MYSSFNIEDEDNKYRLHATKQSPQPSITDFTYLQMGLDNRGNFVAYDADNDERPGKHCARIGFNNNGFGGWMPMGGTGCILPYFMYFNARYPKYKAGGGTMVDYQQSFLLFREKDQFS